MKELINETAQKLIADMVGNPLEYTDGSEDSFWMNQLTIGIIYGITKFAEVLIEENEKRVVQYVENQPYILSGGTSNES